MSTRSYSDRQRTLKWVLLVTVPRTVLDATASVLTRSANDAGASTDCVGQAERKALRTASVRQDQRQYCVLVLRTHPVGAEKVFFTNVAILRRTGIDRLHVAGTNPSHQRWFLPVSATRLRRSPYPSRQPVSAPTAPPSAPTQ